MDDIQLDDAALLEPPEQPASFLDLDLSEPLLKALSDLGYLIPTPVQAAIIPLMKAGLDLIVQAQTGTGKTAAFSIPLVERFALTQRGVNALIVTPTRELALQVAAEIDALGRYHGIRTATVYGGVAFPPQIRSLKNAQIVVGTPGRLLDHLRRGNLSLAQTEVCILDEADEMLSLGFLEDIEVILAHLPEQRQFLLASATMPQDILDLAKKHMVAPEFVTLSTDAIAAEQVDHSYYLVLGRSRLHDLVRIIQAEQPENAIIFCNTRSDTALVASYLQSQGYQAEALSGDLQQREREQILKRCRELQLKFLVATEVAARGIDVSGLSHVINYQLPDQVEMYIHRTGRTGRAGHSGKAISLVSPREMGTFYFLRKMYPIEMTFKELPPEEQPVDPFSGALARALAAEERLAEPASRTDRRPVRTGPGDAQAVEGEQSGQGQPGRRSGQPGDFDRPHRREAGLHRPGGERARSPRRPEAPSGKERDERSLAERSRSETGGNKRRVPGSVGARRNSPASSAGAPSREREGKRREPKAGSQPAASTSGMVRLHLNVGTTQFPGGDQEVRQLLAQFGLLSVNVFGKIDLHPSFSFVEVPEDEASALMERVQDRPLPGGGLLRLERARPRGGR